MSSTLQIDAYANARVPDILFLRKSLEICGHKEVLTQPNHERVRTTSFRRYKTTRKTFARTAKQERKSSNIPFDQRCRKHRRRPAMLMEQRSVRGSTSARWLHTHLWHTKRMHMKVRWNYVLPIISNMRGANAAMADLKDHCILLDSSYCQPIELTGTLDSIVSALLKFTVSCLIFIVIVDECNSLYSHVSDLFRTLIARSWWTRQWSVDTEKPAVC